MVFLFKEIDVESIFLKDVCGSNSGVEVVSEGTEIEGSEEVEGISGCIVGGTWPPIFPPPVDVCWEKDTKNFFIVDVELSPVESTQ